MIREFNSFPKSHNNTSLPLSFPFQKQPLHFQELIALLLTPMMSVTHSLFDHSVPILSFDCAGFLFLCFLFCCVYMYPCVCMSVCVGKNTTLGVLARVPSTFSLRQALSWPRTLISRLGSLAVSFRDLPACASHLTVPQIAGARHNTGFLCGFWRFQLRSLQLWGGCLLLEPSPQPLDPFLTLVSLSFCCSAFSSSFLGKLNGSQLLSFYLCVVSILFSYFNDSLGTIKHPGVFQLPSWSWSEAVLTPEFLWCMTFWTHVETVRLFLVIIFAVEFLSQGLS